MLFLLVSIVKPRPQARFCLSSKRQTLEFHSAFVLVWFGFDSGFMWFVVLVFGSTFGVTWRGDHETGMILHVEVADSLLLDVGQLESV